MAWVLSIEILVISLSVVSLNLPPRARARTMHPYNTQSIGIEGSSPWWPLFTSVLATFIMVHVIVDGRWSMSWLGGRGTHLPYLTGLSHQQVPGIYFGNVCYFCAIILTLKSYKLIAIMPNLPTWLDAYRLHVKNRAENWRRIEKIISGFDCAY